MARALRQVVCAAVLGAACGVASGQLVGGIVTDNPLDDRPSVDQPVRPPKVDTPAPSKTWLSYLIGGLVSAAAVGAVVIPSKRTHQD